MSLSKIYIPPWDLSWLSGKSYFLLLQRKLYVLFSGSLLIYFGIVWIWSLYYRLIRGFGLRLSFYLPKSVRLTLSQLIFGFPYSFKITCFMLRQLIFHKEIVVSSAKFHVLILWSPICIPLIILSILMKSASTPIIIIYNSMENRHSWRTRIMVKGSDRRPFMNFSVMGNTVCLFFSQKIDGKMIFTLSFLDFHDIPVLGKYGFSSSGGSALIR